MRFLRLIGIFLGLAALLTTVPPIHSDEWNKTTKITFSEPVEVPGTVLTTGTYVFKLAESLSDRHIVQIFDADGMHLIATVLAINNYRLEPADKTVLMYQERPVGEPMALDAWFYPGDTFGQQFVYPRTEALRLSQLNKTEVPSTGSEEAYPGHPEHPNTAENVAPSESKPQNPPERAETQPTPAVQANQAPTNPPATTPAPTQNQPTPEQLPHTASFLPLIGMLGLALIGLASLLRLVVRR